MTHNNTRLCKSQCTIYTVSMKDICMYKYSRFITQNMIGFINTYQKFGGEIVWWNVLLPSV